MPASAQHPPGAARALTLLALALALSMTTWFSATAAAPALRAEWALSPSADAWLTIAVQLGFVAGALAASALNLADVVPGRALFAAGAVGAATANALVAVADGPLLATFLRALTGAALALVYPTGLKLVATWSRDARGLGLGVLVGALTLGSAVPHLLHGAASALDWRALLAATSLLTAGGALLLAATVREGPFPFPRAVVDPRQVGRVLADRAVRLASVGYWAHMWELYAVWTWFAAFFAVVLDRAGQPSAAAAGSATFAVIAAGAAGCVAAGAVADRYGRAATNAALLAVSGSCALTIGLLLDAGPWPVLAVGLVWGVAVVGDSAQYSTLVTEHGDQRYVGTALALQLAIGFTLTTATIWLVPLLAAEVGWRYAFMPLALGPAVGIVAMARLAPLEAARRRALARAAAA